MNKRIGLCKILTPELFRQEIINAGKGDEYSELGTTALYNHLMEFSEGMQALYAIDILKVCKQYKEYRNIQDFNLDYDVTYSSWTQSKYVVALVDDGLGAILDTY